MHCIMSDYGKLKLNISKNLQFDFHGMCKTLYFLVKTFQHFNIWLFKFNYNIKIGMYKI